jgi:hypothetical protein
MASTSDNINDVITLTAPAGGVTAGTVSYNSTSKALVLPMTTATSGNTYAGKITGLIRAVAKTTGAAWTVNRSLTWVSSTAKFKSCTGGASQATAYNAALTGDTTGDVVLRLPVTGLA